MEESERSLQCGVETGGTRSDGLSNLESQSVGRTRLGKHAIAAGILEMLCRGGADIAAESDDYGAGGSLVATKAARQFDGGLTARRQVLDDRLRLHPARALQRFVGRSGSDRMKT